MGVIKVGVRGSIFFASRLHVSWFWRQKYSAVEGGKVLYVCKVRDQGAYGKPCRLIQLFTAYNIRLE